MSGIANAGAQLPLEFHRDQSAVFASYYPAVNAETVAALQSLATSAYAQSVYLWGARGTGKTHLLQATCEAAAEAGRVSAYLPLHEALRYGPTVSEGLEQLDVLCVDDVGAVAGRVEWEHGLFRLFNAMRDRGRTLVMSGDVSPRESPVNLADFRSRLEWGLVYQLKPLGDEEKRCLLMARASQRGLELSDDVVQFLLRRCPRDVGSLCALVERLDAASLSTHRQVTIPFVRTFLEAD